MKTIKQLWEQCSGFQFRQYVHIWHLIPNRTAPYELWDMNFCLFFYSTSAKKRDGWCANVAANPIKSVVLRCPSEKCGFRMSVDDRHCLSEYGGLRFLSPCVVCPECDRHFWPALEGIERIRPDRLFTSGGWKARRARKASKSRS